MTIDAGQIEDARQEIVAIAEALILVPSSFIAGSRRINELRFAAKLADDPDILAFVAIDSETDALPIDESIRRLWSAAALEKLAPEIEKAEIWARDFGSEHCRSLINRFKRPRRS